MVTLNRLIREVAPTYTQEEADTFTPSIAPESLPFILSSVVPLEGEGIFPRPIKRYYISAVPTTASEMPGVHSTTASEMPGVHSTTASEMPGVLSGDVPVSLDGPLQIYQGAYIYPYCGVNTMFAHVEVVFDEVPIPHESVLKWCSLALRAGPISASARANQLVVVDGNHLHYLWRVLSVEAEAQLPTTRSLDITNLHLWRWHAPASRWTCGRVSLDVEGTPTGLQHTLTTSRGARLIDWASHTAVVVDEEPIHKLYMALLAENLL